MLVYLIAGESSGDVLGARLMAALTARHPGIAFAGVGGPAMADAGLCTLFPMRDLAVMGLFEVVPRVRTLRARILQTAADIAARRPDAVVTIDSPGFAFRVLRRVPRDIVRVHYVAPQLWGWRPGRAKNLHGLWDALLCLLPFEPAFFARYGIVSDFVGHPVLDSGADRGDAARFRARHGIIADETILVVMPGSRGNEVRHMLPLFQAALRLLTLPVRAVIPVAAPVAAAVTAAVGAWPGAIVVTDTADKHDAFAAATAALVKSGTSSLEVALSGTPMVVAYRANPLTAVIVRRLIRVRYASIVNLIADAPVIPELIQDAATPAAIAAALAPLLTDPRARVTQTQAFAPALAALRPPQGTPSDAAARAILATIAGVRSAG